MSRTRGKILVVGNDALVKLAEKERNRTMSDYDVVEGEVTQVDDAPTGENVTVGTGEYEQFGNVFTYKVPEKVRPGQEDYIGKTLRQRFTFPQVSTEEQAKAIAEHKTAEGAKGWDFVSFVNEALRSAARATAYQALAADFKEVKMTFEEAKERQINGLVRMGVPRDLARSQVESLLAAVGK